MSVPAVRAAVLAIAETVGQLPVHVYERAEDGSKKRAPDHPAYKLLHDEANPWTPASDFRTQLTIDALLHGNGYGEIIRVGDAKPQELHRLDPPSVAIKITATGEPAYEQTLQAGQKRIIIRENVLHLRAPGFDGLCGASPIALARDAIGLAITMERHASRLFGNGARPSGLISFKGELSPVASENLKKTWLASHGGDKSGTVAVLDKDATWESLALTSVDAQFLEMRAFGISEIARVFRVPPVLLQDYGRATWSNAESMGLQFLTYCLMPWIKRWEGELRLKLFKPDERAKFYAEFLIDDLLRADFATRMEGYSKAISSRILNPNEARAAENRAPYEGGEIFANPNTASLTITGPRDEPKKSEANE